MASLTTTSSKPRTKSLGDPCPSYESLRHLWERSRAILNGESHAKAYDDVVDTVNYNNLLIPFSPTMSQAQYNFYKSEAELPGLVEQYAKILLGGILRKPPSIEFSNKVPADAKDWITNQFSANGGNLLSFLDEAIWEELQTSRAWVIVDYPEVDANADLTPEQKKNLNPYAIIVKAENVINWRQSSVAGQSHQTLTRLIIRFYMEEFKDNAFHPDYVDTVMDYHLDDSGLLVIDTYQRIEGNDTINVVNGALKEKYQVDNANQSWTKIRTSLPLMNGERMNFVPAYPLNGQITPVEPMLQPLVNREIALYNKVSRRNHLLYGAATYTPVVMSDMTDEDFDDIVSAGLGSWIKLRAGDEVKALETPTQSLKDMESAINNTIAEMSKMGIRMLAPEGSGDSGVALEIRNAAQTAQLGMLNTKISSTMEQIILTMLRWKYNIDIDYNDVDFELSADFNPVPIGADWMRLITEWYQTGIIPRSTFVKIAKANDVLPMDYDDEEGLTEIQSDPLIDNKATQIDSSIVDLPDDDNKAVK